MKYEKNESNISNYCHDKENTISPLASFPEFPKVCLFDWYLD